MAVQYGIWEGLERAARKKINPLKQQQQQKSILNGTVFPLLNR